MSIRESGLPGGWAAVELGEIATFEMGQAPPGDECNKEGRGTVFVKAGEFGADRPVVREWTAKPLKFARETDVLICVVGATAGKLNLGIDCAIGRSVAAIRPLPSIDQRFLYHQLRPMVLGLRAAAAGSAQGVIAKADLHAVRLLIAPFPEQRRIVAALEERLTALDAAIIALKRARANLKRYRASVLQAACEGRLAPTDAERLIAGGVSPANNLDVAGRELPEGWTRLPLGAIADLKGGLTKGQRRRPEDRCRPVPYLRVANVQRGYLDLSRVAMINATDAEIAALRLQPGDILFNEGGDRNKLGRGWVWNGEIAECIHQNHVFRGRLRDRGIQPKFVSWYANTVGAEYFEREGKQTTNLASINLTKLSALPVALPPAAEQLRIVAEVERRISVSDRFAVEVESALARAARLRQSILKLAFEGRLVPQDPDDEPASILFERMRSEREAGRPPEGRRRPGKRPAARSAQAEFDLAAGTNGGK